MYGAASTGYPMKEMTAAELFGEWAYLRRELWPGAFTLCLFAMFAPAIVASLTIATNATAVYWLGGVGWFILLVPALLVVSHVYHYCAGRPRLFPTIVGTVVPSLIVILIGFLALKPIAGVASKLDSADCTSYPEKYKLDLAYRSAAQTFDTCVQRVATSTSTTAEATAPLLDLSDCSEYKTSPEGDDYSSQWAYLQKMEVNQVCSGWCTPGEPALWTRTHYAMDLCANAAAAELTGKVANLGRRLMLLGILELIASIYVVLTMQAVLKKTLTSW
mmetsp:Transcript_31163/g.85380  ORF Transcript_31163/g.85380 Transcript_31163/m.85380 type:complete len:275 (+) Transcript_31163:114-938(+)|eukprot:CAMPEP_0117537512 /NCGR_PEP_ID=MMETSP0784-20121206/42003_1 /TAXON_ID=39447 /ORGANISM="" /LENGTH=274 /DNA_ID=CAMNT_0005334101 /DNA_START=47 /DNA_END=871 /DNA_ORIENTATION=+